MAEQDFIKAGFTVVGTENNENKLLRFLKENYPSIIKDNEIDLQELKAIAGLPVDEKVNGYGLNFVGRNFARAKYAQKTEKELRLNTTLSKNIDTTENLVLKGDNLDSLKILKNHYSGKIKCIYIDPPYNTKSDEFVYPDKFDKEEAEVLGLANLSESDFARMDFSFKTKKSHNGWLAFMYPRLLLARDLLSKEGVIFISIDDNEQANLKLLCDEVFGEENFINVITVNMNSLSGVKMTHAITGKRFPAQKEYVLLYKKGIKATPLHIEKTHKEQWDKEYNMIIPELSEFQFANFNELTDEEVNNLLKEMTLQSLSDFAKVNNIDLTEEWKWKNSYRIFGTKSNVSLAKRNRNISHSQQIVCYTNNDGNKRFYRSDYNKDVKDPRIELVQAEMNSSVFLSDNWIDISNDGGVAQEGGVIFPNGKKPLALIMRILKSSNFYDGIFLDFFAGSGTTGHAVMSLNKDGGNRKFILCQIDEPIKENKPEYKFCLDNNLPPLISSITIERLKRAGEKIAKEIEAENSKNELFEEDKKQVPDIGFKVFDSVEAPKLKVDDKGQISFPENDTDALSRIYNMIFTVGLDEPTQVPEEVVKDCIYKVGNHYYITNSEKITSDDYSNAIKNGKVFIDGWTASLNGTLQNYKEDVKIVF